jgi:hypothetical protein
MSTAILSSLLKRRTVRSQNFFFRSALSGVISFPFVHVVNVESSIGIRIGECTDLSFDCLRLLAPGQWALHAPLGKLNTERVVPIDDSSASWYIVCASSGF